MKNLFQIQIAISDEIKIKKKKNLKFQHLLFLIYITKKEI